MWQTKQMNLLFLKIFFPRGASVGGTLRGRLALLARCFVGWWWLWLVLSWGLALGPPGRQLGQARTKESELPETGRRSMMYNIASYLFRSVTLYEYHTFVKRREAACAQLGPGLHEGRQNILKFEKKRWRIIS